MYEEIGQQISIRQKQFILNNREFVLPVPRESKSKPVLASYWKPQLKLHTNLVHYILIIFFKMFYKTARKNHLSGTISLMVLLSS